MPEPVVKGEGTSPACATPADVNSLRNMFEDMKDMYETMRTDFMRLHAYGAEQGKRVDEIDQEQRAQARVVSAFDSKLSQAELKVNGTVQKLQVDQALMKNILSVLAEASSHHGERLRELREAMRSRKSRESGQEHRLVQHGSHHVVLYKPPPNDDE